ncbi:MAG TPA: flagellar hook assembly protein FlgD [Holophaga sp.]|nr:flagellar hook assembly protein FlgD [Holophaga sp.]
MQTANVGSTNGTTSSSTSSKATKSLDKDAFLKLLVAQLQHQDPTNTQDPTQMVQQMATFSSLEAQQNTNNLLASIQTQNSALYQAQSADLIGKKIQITSGKVALSGGAAQVGVNMGAAGDATFTIKNAKGVTVATLGPVALEAGDTVLSWNGQDANGTQLPDGNYTVTVSAKNATGSSVTASTTTTATVSAVSFVDNEVKVTAGGNQYSLSNITRISN